jgi:hypothetical protein
VRKAIFVAMTMMCLISASLAETTSETFLQIQEQLQLMTLTLF